MMRFDFRTPACTCWLDVPETPGSGNSWCIIGLVLLRAGPRSTFSLEAISSSSEGLRSSSISHSCQSELGGRKFGGAFCTEVKNGLWLKVGRRNDYWWSRMAEVRQKAGKYSPEDSERLLFRDAYRRRPSVV